MTVIATASNPRFSVSRVDIDRPGQTYTIDTLRDWRDHGPDVELFFITGADALAQILSWQDADELFSLAHFVGVTRPGHVLPTRACPEAASAWSRCPRWRSPPASAGERVRPGSPCGTWFPMESCSTSINKGFIVRLTRNRGRVSRRNRREPVTASDRATELVQTAAEAAAEKLVTTSSL